jgi:hypothetical protein
MSRKISASGAFSTSERRCIMGSVIGVSPGSSFATQTYPKITVTTSNPSYTTQGDRSRAFLPFRPGAPSVNDSEGFVKIS